MRDFLRQYMLYSRSERRAVIALIFLIIIVILIPKGYHFYFVKASPVYIDTTLHRSLEVFQKNDLVNGDSMTTVSLNHTVDSPAINKLSAHLFFFDPNTISIADWELLGLSEKQAEVIEKYKSKGGRFRNPDDLRKIYVLSDEMKSVLVPYVHIAANNESKSKGIKGFYSIEINTADSAAYEALYGIGPAYASRIVKYRRILGGFYSVEQVRETYGISDSTFMLIKPHLTVNPALVNKIDINNADYEILRKHPYIHAKIAHAIIGYRTMNGKFESLDKLKELKLITEDVFNKIAPYLKAGTGL